MLNFFFEIFVSQSKFLADKKERQRKRAGSTQAEQLRMLMINIFHKEVIDD